MPVRSRVFSVYSGAHAVGVVSRYTCPTGKTAIIHHYCLTTTNDTTAIALVGVRRSGVVAWAGTARTLDKFASLTGVRIILQPGDELVTQLNTSPALGAGGGGTFYAAGSLLDGVSS